MSRPEDELNLEDVIQDQGLTSYNRRLADKILNAFNQATAVGRLDVAEQLESALKLCVDEEQEMRNAVLVEKAACWRRFVEARDAYKRAVKRFSESAPETESALTAMRQAYQEWRQL